jgi:hypothetical protein
MLIVMEFKSTVESFSWVLGKLQLQSNQSLKLRLNQPLSNQSLQSFQFPSTHVFGLLSPKSLRLQSPILELMRMPCHRLFPASVRQVYLVCVPPLPRRSLARVRALVLLVLRNLLLDLRTP